MSREARAILALNLSYGEGFLQKAHNEAWQQLAMPVVLHSI